MTTFLRPVFLAAACLPLIFSCNKTENDTPRNRHYVNVTLESGSYFFTDDRDKTYYPGDVSRIGAYPTPDTETGNRAFIWYNLLPKAREGYDFNIALYGVEDILTKTVEVAETEGDVENAGNDPLEIERITLNGRWVDITFALMTDTGDKIEHKMTLLDNRLADAPESMPEDYQYLEFRQSGNNVLDRILGFGNVSYNLGDYEPSVAGTKGLYIGYRGFNGDTKYARLDYNGPRESSAGSGSGAPAATGLSLK